MHWLTERALRLTRFASAHALLLMTTVVGGVLFVGLTVAVSEVYEAVVEQDGLAQLDHPALAWSISLRTPANQAVVTWFTHLGGVTGMTIIALAITVAMVWRWRSRSALILMAVAVAGSLTVTTVGKRVIGRIRPPQELAVPPFEYAFSFPSGHTLNSTVITGMIAYLICCHSMSRRVRASVIAGAAAWSVAMGISRVFLGHHWLTDVIVAWLLGLAWLTLLITAHRSYLHVRDAQRRAKAVGAEGLEPPLDPLP